MKPQRDYSFIRGVCHPGAWIRSDREMIEKELGYAQRLNLNSSRIWLMKRQHDNNPDAFVEKLQHTCEPLILTALLRCSSSGTETDWT